MEGAVLGDQGAFGAGDHEKLRTTYVFAIRGGVILEAGVALASFTFAPLIARAFTGELTADWRTAHDNELAQAARERDEILGRKPGAIRSRLKKLALIS